MEKEEFIRAIKKCRSQKQKFINDTYLWVSLAIKSFETTLESKATIRRTKFHVPSKISGKSIIRKPEEYDKILKSAQEKDLYQATFLYIVSQFEAFLSDIIVLNLQYDTRKLRLNISGSESNKKLDISEILDCESQESIINLIIEKQVNELFYSGPRKQKEYIEKVISIELSEDLWLNWFEYKATRDLLLHNLGIINSVYLQKAGNLSRGNLNEKIGLDKKYFENTLANIKSLIGKIAADELATLKDK